MPGETFVTVRGEAQLEVEPEIALLGVTVTARDRDRSRAVEQLASRIREVGDLIKGYGDAVERLESQPVRVQPLLREAEVRGVKIGSGRGTVGYLAQAGFSVTIGEFTVLGELVAALASQDLVTLGGPSWQLRPDSPAYREVRLAAARDSLQRARDYAEAFGGQITGLAEAADTGLLAGNSGHAPMAFAAAAMRSRSAGAEASSEPPEIDLWPAVQTVYAQVEARFTMTQPTMGG